MSSQEHKNLSSFEDRHEDYTFFMDHSTEAELCRRATLDRLATWAADRDGRIRLLDFGCGSGEFLRDLLKEWGLPSTQLELTLLDVDALALNKAQKNLAGLCAAPPRPVRALDQLAGETYDVILSNHALYYVEDLGEILRSLSALIAPGGTAIFTLGGKQNRLCGMWELAYSARNSELPFYLAEDVEAELEASGVAFERAEIASNLSFEDSHENREKILRFLFGKRLADLDQEALFGFFDAWRSPNGLVMDNHDLLFQCRKS